ncbi:hypothetical protein BDB01DRAFT_854779 [Pilobolus umbonatus]|nr:hypothetical protein BDB01DRAFT_854779 [Pilobolus umbonatus]
MLPPKLLAKHHDFNLTEGAIIGTGAIKTVQDQLKKDNYIPLVKNEETLKDISQGNIMYIDLSWDNSSVLYINSENKESSIRDFSMIGNCYSLNECFYVTKHQHEFQVSSISITDK